MRASFALLVLALAFATGCGRQEPLQATTGTASEGQQLPFGAGKNGVSPVRGLTPSSVPAGTPITIRLRTALSSATSRAGDSFEAVLDAPVVVEGQTIVPAGAAITGRVVASAKSSTRPQDFGYLRLTVTTIEIGGTPVSVRTSSIFARGANGKHGVIVISGNDAAYGTTAKDVGFATDRRLSFHLAQPLSPGG